MTYHDGFSIIHLKIQLLTQGLIKAWSGRAAKFEGVLEKKKRIDNILSLSIMHDISIFSLFVF